MKFPAQRTIKKSISFSGVSLHSGKKISVTLNPASVNTGIVFRRVDLPGAPSLKAQPSKVNQTKLATQIACPEQNITFSTTEHLLAAVFAFGISNLIIDVSGGEEMPIMDGSALPFLMLIDEAGIEIQNKSQDILLIQKPLEVVDAKDPKRFIRIEPSLTPAITYSIDFRNSDKIQSQNLTTYLDSESLFKEILFARTFCHVQEIEFLRSQGLALGGSLANAIVVDQHKVLNQQGLRDDLEFVKHKILDCVGDLALLGRPIAGHIYAFKAGHDLHTALAKKIEESIGNEVKLLSAEIPVESVNRVSLQYLENLGNLLSFVQTKALVRG